METYANRAATALTSAIGIGDTSILINDQAELPTLGSFRLRIEDEILLATASGTLTLPVVRGVEGTTAVAHSAGASVAHVLTAGSVEQLQVDQSTGDDLADQFDGRLLLAEDTVAVSSSQVWRPMGRQRLCPRPSHTAGWSWALQGGSVLFHTGDTGEFTFSVKDGMFPSSPNQAKASVYEAPMSGSTVEASLSLVSVIKSNGSVQGNSGVCLRDSVNGDIVALEVNPPSGGDFSSAFFLRHRTSLTSTSTASSSALALLVRSSDLALKIEHVSASSVVRGFGSIDGVNWTQVAEITEPTGFTPDRAGISLRAGATSDLSYHMTTVHSFRTY